MVSTRKKRATFSDDIPAVQFDESSAVKKAKNICKKDKKYTLHEAARVGADSVIYQLIQQRVDLNQLDEVNNDGNTALMIALENNRFSTVNLLLAASASITVRNHAKLSAYDIAKSMLETNRTTIPTQCIRIVKFMRTKENLLKYRMNNFIEDISAFVKGKSQVTRLEWDHIAALFPIKKREMLMDMGALGTKMAISMMNHLSEFNPFMPVKPIAGPARFFAPANIQVNNPVVDVAIANPANSK